MKYGFIFPSKTIIKFGAEDYLQIWEMMKISDLFVSLKNRKKLIVSLFIIIISIYLMVLKHDKEILQSTFSLLNDGYYRGGTLTEAKWGNIEAAKAKLDAVYFSDKQKQDLLAEIKEREIERNLGVIQLTLVNSQELDIVVLNNYREQLISYKGNNYQKDVFDMLTKIDSQIEFLNANSEFINGNYSAAYSKIQSYIYKYPTGSNIREAQELLRVTITKLRVLIKESMEKENPALARAKATVGDNKVDYKILEKNTGKKSEFIRVYVSNPTRERIIVALQEMIQKGELGGVLANKIWFESTSKGGNAIAEYKYSAPMYGSPEKGVLSFKPRGEEINFPKSIYIIW